jgi:RNA polymerase sigma-70 factor (sigma-E family)
MIARVEGTVIGITDRAAVDPSFDELYQQLWWPMLRLATGLVDEVSVAEDVVQDAFAATYRRWEAIRDRQAAAGYLRTAVVNGSRSVLRRRITARKHLRCVVDEPVDAADHSLLRIAEGDRVLVAMSMLPDRQREVLTLRYVAELSDADIAQATGLSEGGVRSASSRALAALRMTLGGQL